MLVKKVIVSACVKCVNFFLLHIMGKADSKFSGKIFAAHSYSLNYIFAYC